MVIQKKMEMRESWPILIATGSQQKTMQKAHFHTEAVSLVDKDELNNSVSILQYGCGSYFKYLGVQSYLLLHLCLN